MTCMNRIGNTLVKAGKFINRHSPAILTACGVVGVVTTAVLAAKEAPIANKKLEELHEQLAETDEELTKQQIIFKEIKAIAPVYAPAVISGVTSIGCIIGSNRISTKRTASIAAAYEVAQTSLIEYQNKVVEKFGEKKAKEVRDSIAQDRINKNPPSDSVVNGVIGDGQQWFYDETTEQYFRSTVDDIRKAERKVSDMLHSGYSDYVTVNDFLYEIGSNDLKTTSRAGEDNVFWADRNGIDIHFSSVVAPGPISALSLEYEVYNKEYIDHIWG